MFYIDLAKIFADCANCGSGEDVQLATVITAGGKSEMKYLCSSCRKEENAKIALPPLWLA